MQISTSCEQRRLCWTKSKFVVDLREERFGNEAVDGVGDGGGGFGKSLRIDIEEPNVDAVHGGDLGDSRTHLAAAYHSDSLHRHCFSCHYLVLDQVCPTRTDNNAARLDLTPISIVCN